MNSWVPVAILPNLSGGRAIEAEVVALAPFDDPRVQAMRKAIPLFAELLSRFTDAFGVRLEPFVFIARIDAILDLSADALNRGRSIRSTTRPTALRIQIPLGSILGR